MIAVNIEACSTASRRLCRTRNGRRPATSSTSRRWPATRSARASVYAATKHPVRALSEGLRQEVKPYNIRTTVLSPGAVATELVESVTDPDARARIQAFCASTAIPADSFARAVAFAISQPDDVDINENRLPADPAGRLTGPSGVAGVQIRVVVVPPVS